VYRFDGEFSADAHNATSEPQLLGIYAPDLRSHIKVHLYRHSYLALAGIDFWALDVVYLESEDISSISSLGINSGGRACSTGQLSLYLAVEMLAFVVLSTQM